MTALPAKPPLSLRAYLALRPARPDRAGEAAAEPAERPEGPLVWLHAEGAEAGEALGAFAAHLAQRPGAPALLITGETSSAAGISRPAPADNAAAGRALVESWRPGALVWFGPPGRPALLSAVSQAGVPALLVPAGARLAGGRRRWLPGLSRAILSLFDMVLTEERGQVADLLRAGAREAHPVGALVPSPPILPCSRAELEEVSEAIGPRPAWLAAEAPLGELQALVQAQRRATRATHRLLLAIVPADPGDAPAFARAFRAEGLSVADRAAGEEPGETTEVCLADGVSDLGLWYRMAALTYLGGTMSRGGGRHPFEPAAMGSAVLHGIRTEPHDSAYRRLARAGASRVVTSGEDLGAMVETLLMPDKAAMMAHAAWSVTSQGAEALDRLAERLMAVLPAEGEG
ncbi:3-deoxy-D-manno-octulosonic acid transferase [Pseudoroseicyclus sp. H15]